MSEYYQHSEKPDVKMLSQWLEALVLPSVALPLKTVSHHCAVSEQQATYRMDIQFAFPIRGQESLLEEELRHGLGQAFPDLDRCDIHLDSKIVAYKAANACKPIGGVKNIIAVASGKGGVGKSSTAVNVALALQTLGARVGILDADIYGPNLGLMLGVPEGTRPQVEAQKYFLPLEVKGLQSMSMSYVTTENTPMVWRGPKASGAFSQLLSSTLWKELDYLLFDMPPGTGDIQLTMAQTVAVNGALIVTTPQTMATQDAQKGIEMFNKVSVPVLGLVENMSTHICSQCGHEEHIFGHGGGELLSQRYGVPFLGAMPLDGSIREDCDAGFPTVAKAPDSVLAKRYVAIALKLAACLANDGEVLDNAGIRLLSE